MKKGWLLVPLMLLSLAMTACAGTKSGQEGEKTDMVYMENGALVVALAGNPTTGYEWTLEDEPVCLSVGERVYTQGAASELAIGTGGVFLFRFEPISAGEQTLRFVYSRSWEPDSAVEQYELTVTVTETADGYAVAWQ